MFATSLFSLLADFGSGMSMKQVALTFLILCAVGVAGYFVNLAPIHMVIKWLIWVFLGVVAFVVLYRFVETL